MAFALIGPSQTVSVAFAGRRQRLGHGARSVRPPRCSGVYPQGQVALLTATPADFAGFSGPCGGTGICQAKMDSGQTVTATFGVPTGTRITKAKIDSKKKKATFSFSAPGAITGYQCMLIKPKTKRKQTSARRRNQQESQEAEVRGLRRPENLQEAETGQVHVQGPRPRHHRRRRETRQAGLQNQGPQEEEAQGPEEGREVGRTSKIRASFPPG